MIAWDTLSPLWLFIILMVGTPGPANMLIMAAGAERGFWACMPFNGGLIVGKVAVNIAMAFGFGALLQQNIALEWGFKIACVSYMTYLAMKGWNTAPAAPGASGAALPPLRLRDGLLVHPLNPKAWVMSGLAFANFGPAFGDMPTQFVTIALSFVAFQVVLHGTWCLAGALTAQALGRSQVLNRGLIVLTLAVVLWAVFASSTPAAAALTDLTMEAGALKCIRAFGEEIERARKPGPPPKMLIIDEAWRFVHTKKDNAGCGYRCRSPAFFAVRKGWGPVRYLSGRILGLPLSAGQGHLYGRYGGL